MPDTAVLKQIRKEISLYSNEFLGILNNPDFKKHFPELDQESKLVKVPQGFEKDDPMADFLKLKNFIVVYNLNDQELLDKEAFKNLAAIYETMKPLNDFLNTAVS